MRIRCTLNGAPRDIEAEPLERALDVLRRIGLTGTKEGCGEGECGSCTIMMDGLPVNSCLVIASQLDGATLLTVEGLSQGALLSSLQRLFIEHGATQCGICTPGILMAAEYLLAEVTTSPQSGVVSHQPQVDSPQSGVDSRPSAHQRFDVDAIRRWASLSPQSSALSPETALPSAPRTQDSALRTDTVSPPSPQPSVPGPDDHLDAQVEREIRTCLAGNICRCTGYDSIVRAVKDALRDRIASAPSSR